MPNYNLFAPKMTIQCRKVTEKSLRCVNCTTWWTCSKLISMWLQGMGGSILSYSYCFKDFAFKSSCCLCSKTFQLGIFWRLLHWYFFLEFSFLTCSSTLSPSLPRVHVTSNMHSREYTQNKRMNSQVRNSLMTYKTSWVGSSGEDIQGPGWWFSSALESCWVSWVP